MTVADDLERQAHEYENQAAELLRQAKILRDTVARLRKSTLTDGHRRGTLNVDMSTPSQRGLAISAGYKPRTPSMARLTAGGYSMRSAADFVGVDVSMLSRVFAGERHLRPEKQALLDELFAKCDAVAAAKNQVNKGS